MAAAELKAGPEDRVTEWRGYPLVGKGRWPQIATLALEAPIVWETLDAPGSHSFSMREHIGTVDIEDGKGTVLEVSQSLNRQTFYIEFPKTAPKHAGQTFALDLSSAVSAFVERVVDEPDTASPAPSPSSAEKE